MNEISEGTTEVVLKTRGDGELLASEIRNEGMKGGETRAFKEFSTLINLPSI